MMTATSRIHPLLEHNKMSDLDRAVGALVLAHAELFGPHKLVFLDGDLESVLVVLILVEHIELTVEHDAKVVRHLSLAQEGGELLAVLAPLAPLDELVQITLGKGGHNAAEETEELGAMIGVGAHAS